MTRSDSTVHVTRSGSTKLWLDSDSTRKFLDDSNLKRLWLWLDKHDSGTSLTKPNILVLEQPLLWGLGIGYFEQMFVY